MLKGLIKGAPQPGEEPGSGNSRSIGASGLSGLLMMKKKVSRWRANRRQSMQSWNLNSGRQSQACHKPPAMENTYRMAPDTQGRFCPDAVRAAAKKAMERVLRPQKGYDAKKTALLTRLVSEDVKAAVKALGYSRYKYVVQVLLGQDSGQDVQMASRCVWDSSVDGQATAVLKHHDIYCVANIFGTYYE